MKALGQKGQFFLIFACLFSQIFCLSGGCSRFSAKTLEVLASGLFLASLLLLASLLFLVSLLLLAGLLLLALLLLLVSLEFLMLSLAGLPLVPDGITIAGLPAIARVPGVVGISAVAFVPRVASVPPDPGVLIFAGTLHSVLYNVTCDFRLSDSRTTAFGL